jgi:uncharacterized protein YggE
MRSLTLLLCLLILPVAARAQPAPASPDVPVVVSTGEGIVKRTPDRAWVMIAAESRARTPQEAQKLNADAMTGVLQKLKSSGIPADATRTTGYDLQPEFDYANNRRTLRGYVARNSVEVRVDDLQRLGEILEGTVSAGATNVSGVRFDVKDRAGAEREALTLAVKDARSRADAAASGAGVKVERVLKIEEQRAVSMPPQPRMVSFGAMEAAQRGEPPIAPGEIEIHATVTLTAAIR